MKTTKSQLNDVSQILELEDNKVLVDLYGQHDENLAKIENNFGIHISYRGNVIELRGNQEACSSASKLISDIYKKLANGKKINEEIFDNISRNSNNSDAKDLNTVLIRTKRKNIYPRSQNQLKFVNLIKEKGKANKKEISKSEAEKILKEAHDHNHDHDHEKKDIKKKSDVKTAKEKKPSTKTAKSKPAAKKTKKVSKK